MAFALQLHRDLEYDPMGRTEKTQLSSIDREIRRRIMWACFLMDRFNSSGTDRPTFVKEETIQIPLPVKEKYFQFDMPAPTETLDGRLLHPASPDDGQIADPRENMGVAAYLIRAIALWGRIITLLNQGGKDGDPLPMWDNASQYAKLLEQVKELDAGLPSSVKCSPENIEVHKTENTASQLLFLHICLQHNILFLSRAAMSARKRPGAPDEFFSEATRRTFGAANRISDLLKEAEQSRCFPSAPFAGYCAFSSTTVHILGIISRNPSMKPVAEANLTTNVKYLHRMKKYWGMFHWMVEDVRTQYRNALDVTRTGASSSERAAQSSYLQYGDWFNRYPHGLSDAEFMDPATHQKKDAGADGVLGAKTELQSVEEYLSTLPGQHAETRDDNRKDGGRVSATRHKSSARSQSGAVAQHGQQMSKSEADVAGPQQQSRVSDAMGPQSGGPTGFSPLSTAHMGNSGFSNAMSPLSQAELAFSQHTQIPPFFPQDLLAMNFGQQTNGILQPLDRQLVFGGYSMDTSAGLASGQNMMDNIDWESLAAGAPGDRGMHGRRDSAKAGMNGSVTGSSGTDFFNGPEASSAWFMPFNLEPPEMTQDPGLSMGNVDPFAGMFGGGDNNPMNGLQQRGP